MVKRMVWVLFVSSAFAMPVRADMVRHEVAQLADDGRVRLKLTAASDSDERLGGTRLESVGLRQENRQGQVLWLDRRPGRGTEVGVGLRLEF